VGKAAPQPGGIITRSLLTLFSSFCITRLWSTGQHYQREGFPIGFGLRFVRQQNVRWGEGSGTPDGVRDHVTRTLRELGFAPRVGAKAYHKPYPEYFDTVPYPRVFRDPYFVKFTVDDSRTTYDHIGQYLAQINNVGINDIHRVRLFSLSLSGVAFSWFTSLVLNSINTWAGLEEKFNEYFYNGGTELKLSDLMTIR
jgi:hypothetical protein